MRHTMIGAVGLVVIAACSAGPAPWDGPVLSDPRTQLTVDQLHSPDPPPLLDMSFFARPDWALPTPEPLIGQLTLRAADLQMTHPVARDRYPGEGRFPTVTLELVSHDGALIPAQRGVIATGKDSLWNFMVGAGAVWREQGDEGWSRASLPLSLVDRAFNQVRNCVTTFVYREAEVSHAAVQCSQETADANDEQLGDLRALVPATFVATTVADPSDVIDAHRLALARRIPTRPLTDWDRHGDLAAVFDTSWVTRASTSVGAVYDDGILYVHPAMTRHGPFPYPSELHHGVYSVTKTLAGALSMFYLAERYGDEVFDALVTDHVPALADRAGWQGVTFSHALNMATGTRGGEDAELLYEPLILADSPEEAIANIAALGDAPSAPGEVFQYATTNTFVLSYALQRYVESREGERVRYWDLVRDGVLDPIGAGDLEVLLTPDDNADERIPYLGYGARPTLDQAAKIAVLLANEGVHEGRPLLHTGRIREALGRTDWPGISVTSRVRYRHAFWSQDIRTGGCRSDVSAMQGYGGNHVILLPSGVIVFRFTDELGEDITPLVRAAERVTSSCGAD